MVTGDVCHLPHTLPLEVVSELVGDCTVCISRPNRMNPLCTVAVGRVVLDLFLSDAEQTVNLPVKLHRDISAFSSHSIPPFHLK